MKTSDLSITQADVQKAFDSISADLKKFATHLSKLDEAITVPVDGDLEQQLAELTKRFDAARRGLGLVNKLSLGAQKTMNARRVMGNLNIIRAKLQKVQAAMADYLRAEAGYENASDLDSAHYPMAASGEQEEETPRGWGLNTLDSIMKSSKHTDNSDDGFCPDCWCQPCECAKEQEEEWCPDCDGYEHNSSIHPEMRKGVEDHQQAIKDRNLRSPFEQEEEEDGRFSELKRAVRNSKNLKDWNLKNPFGEENEETINPELRHAVQNSKEVRDRNLRSPFEQHLSSEQEEEGLNICPECHEEPCECCHFCRKANCTC